jgi:hypothetical protein
MGGKGPYSTKRGRRREKGRDVQGEQENGEIMMRKGKQKEFRAKRND